MAPIEFPEQNVVFAKDQPEYLPLPAHVTTDGQVTTCWEMTPEEREVFLKTGRIYLRVLTFGQPLQPLMLSVEYPFELG